MAELIRDAAQADIDAVGNLRDHLLLCERGIGRLAPPDHARAAALFDEVRDFLRDAVRQSDEIMDAVWDDERAAQAVERAEAACRAGQRRLPLEVGRAA